MSSSHQKVNKHCKCLLVGIRGIKLLYLLIL
nr:MAG TPA: protein of unknown function (DUF4710) [Crassvirales sp.]